MLTLEGLVLDQGGFRLTADMTLPQGLQAAVTGPSGAGKSTLLAVLAGFLAPTEGRILWQGADITTLPPDRRPVSMLFQDNNLFPHLTAAQNVGLGIRPSLKLTGEEHARVEATLAEVELAGFGARKPAALSGGQQSRVALARVMVQDNPILLLDEPFAALGPAMRRDLLQRVCAHAHSRNALLLVVTHAPQQAVGLLDQALLVAGGRVAPPEPLAALLADPPPELAAYLGGSEGASDGA